MKRAVICVQDPQHWIPQLSDYSIMIINPASPPTRKQYLLDQADWSLLVDEDGEHWRSGGDYDNEKALWYTSGTTGDSKFCSFTQQQLDIMAQRICRSYDITVNDRYTSIMPLWHAHGQGFYWATLYAGCEANYVSIKNIKDIPRNHPTFITAIPDILKIIAHLEFTDLRFIRSASAPLSNFLYQGLKEKFHVPVIEAFGMTEACSHCFTNPLYGEQRPGTVGLPDGIEAKIADGHLLIRGDTVITNSWYDTGDLAEQDPAGYYRILGRTRDQINVRGIKINPVSLENQLLDAVPGVDECAIFGKDRVNCVYVGTASVDEISTFLSSLGNYCRPALVKSVEFIPPSPSGKISRTFLNSLYE